MERKFRCGMVVGFALIFFSAGGPAVVFGWTITDLGLGAAYEVNNAGQVVGEIDAGGNAHGVVWSNGTVSDLGTLTGGVYSSAQDINNFGQVVGYSSVGRADGTLYMDPEPFLWDKGSMTQLVPSGLGALAYAINDSGQAVGFSIASDYPWGYGVSLTLPYAQFTLGSAFDINNDGQAVGYGIQKGAGMEAVLWDQGGMTLLDSLDLAYSINNRGQVVGITSDGSAALWDNGSVTEIAPAKLGGGKLFEISDSGQVVGSGLIINNSPYLWDSGTLTDLNSLVADTGWILESANGINDFGQIVGCGILQGEQHAFLLTPETFTPAPVPEPSTVFLVGIGIAGLAGLQILKKKSFLPAA